jgi:flagellar hook assembly protein FlgD
VSVTSHVTLRIYSPSGELVRTLVDRQQAPGNHDVMWDGTNDSGETVASGVYVYQMRVGKISFSKKMTIIK